ncbi:MAG: GNAT family N-acetyltransferase [Caldilineaceae bacterium]|nr:GNAT family N-acetyltransferase [Caldilineaceae bacterium]
MKSCSGENRPEMRCSHTVEGPVLDILSQDPVWNAYAIADLRPDLARHCRWLVAPDASGLALLYFGLVPPVLLTTGSIEGVAAALTGADLPDELFLSILPSHLPAVEQHYHQVVPREMVRMALPPGRPVPSAAPPARRLDRADAGRLIDLYRLGGDYAPDAFDPGQLNDGYYFGIDDEDGTLAAAGGTHVSLRTESQKLTNGNAVSLDQVISRGVAAIGNIYTRPERRGRGYGKAVISSITRALQDDGFSLIVLNVDKQNLVAKSIYEKLGFDVHCHFIEGLARKVQQSSLAN